MVITKTVMAATVMIFVLMLNVGGANAAITWPMEPAIKAKSWALLDARSGQILAKHNENERLAPASMTKMMTLYLAFEAANRGTLNLDERLNVSKKAWKIGGSTMFLEPRMHPTAREVLHGIATFSGNDAAIVIAEHLSGSTDEFVRLMNAKASQLGMENTHFMNVTGFPEENHFSTAMDMAKIGVALWRDFPVFFDIFKEKSYVFDGRKQWNRNRLLWSMPEAQGLKTGHTEDAGYCLTGAVEKGNMRIVSALFGAESDKERQGQSKVLLTYGLRQFVTIGPKERDIQRKIEVFEGKTDFVWLKPSKQVWITLPKGAEKHIEFKLEYKSPQLAPIEKGQQLGTIEVTLDTNNETIVMQSIPMLAQKDVERASWFGRKADALKLWWREQ